MKTLNKNGNNVKCDEDRLLYQYYKVKLVPERMDYLEFIDRVTSHIPDKGQVMIR